MSDPLALATLPHALLLSVEQVVMLLGISERKIWSMVSAGGFPAPKKIDRLTRWRRSDVDKWVESLT